MGESWPRDTMVAQVKGSQGVGGCPLGSPAPLAETDPQARTRIAAGFTSRTARTERAALPYRVKQARI